MKIFVTGSESFIGKELAKQCREKSIEVLGVDIAAKLSSWSSLGDIRDPSIADMIPEGVDAIVHLGGLSRDPDCKNNAYECFDVNVMGTLNLIRAAKKKKARQFIFASSEWVYDRFDKKAPPKSENAVIDISNVLSEYAISKLVSESNLRQQFQHGFCPVTILRFGIVYGPRKENWSAVEAILNSVATKDVVAVGSLRTGRHFIHVADITSAIIASLGLVGFEILNIQADQLSTLGDIINAAKKVLGKDPKIVETNPEAPSIRPVSNEKGRRLINWTPITGLEKGLASIADFLDLR